jgi:3',5'-cyclic AMP phosphodiesterase CpdA
MTPKYNPAHQISIIHLSDLHFGEDHRFLPERTPTGDRPTEFDYPTLSERLGEDLRGDTSDCPVVLCVTGDFAHTAALSEFERSGKFLQDVLASEVLSKRLTKDDIFLVPGNHDVAYAEGDVGARFQQYLEFHNRFYGEHIPRENPWSLCRVYDRVESHGAIFACLNSSIYIRRGEPDQDRGNLDVKQLTYLEQSLEAVPKDKLHGAIKIALVHHHPVLIPQLAEPKRGYDAINNSGAFLSILKRFQFHAVLHGHKHNPYTFTEDSRAAYTRTNENPIFFSCAGSIGSKSLPINPGISNCYNRITIKWHPEGNQFRVRCVTRGLSIFNDDGTDRLPSRWRWFDMKVFDRHFISQNYPVDLAKANFREFEDAKDAANEKQRCTVYEKTHGNLPVVEVRPSLLADQAYEAIVWMMPHPLKDGKTEHKRPISVTWSAGPRFGVKEVTATERANYAASFDYWGPMLIQAHLKFADASEAFAYVYAHLPVGNIIAT